jgi:hypothetical protein
MDSDAAGVLVDRHLSALLADLARQPADQAIPALHAGVARLQAALVQQLGSFQATDGPQHDGCKTLRSWTRLHLRESPAGAGRLATAVSTLGELPGVAAAFSGGEISLDHVAAFGTGLATAGADAMRAHQHTLLRLARQASAAELSTAIAELADIVDPDRDATAVQALTRRGYTGARVGDLYVFNGAVDPVCGEQLAAWVAAHAAPVKTADGRPDPRTAQQRRADAFTALVDTAVTRNGLPERVRSTAAVIMTISLDTLAGIAGTGALLERFGRIPSPTAQRLLCDATLTRVILDPAGHPVDVGRTHRSHTTAQATALAAIHTTCFWPGCTVAFRDCEIHHLLAWQDGGPTDLANLRPACKHHHTWLHEGGYTVTIHPGRRLTFHDPRGHLIPDPAPHLQRAVDQLRLDTTTTGPHTPHPHRTPPPPPQPTHHPRRE